MLIAEAARRWPRMAPGRGKDTTAHNAAMVRMFVTKYGDRELDAITPIMAQEWAMRHGGQVRYLKCLWNDCVRLGLCVENPWLKVRRGETGTIDHRPPSEAQLEAILGACGPFARDLFTVMAFTGLRISEAAAVHRSDVVQVPSMRLRVRKGKGNRTQDRVVVFGPARDVFRHLLGHRHLTCELLMRESKYVPQRRPWDRFAASREWDRACETIGFSGTMHSLRRFHATWLLDQGVSPLDAAVQLRHFDKAGRPYPDLVLKLYAHPDPDIALSRLEAIG